MHATHRQSAEAMRARLLAARCSPVELRAALTSVPPGDRDAWLDVLLGIGTLPDDGPALPRACVPYAPCAVDALLRLVELADVRASDVFVDIGSGLGRATTLVHLLTGATTIGLEVQPELVRAARALASDLGLERCTVLEGDAVQLVETLTVGSIFFLYCPFSGARLARVLARLELVARTRELRICCVDLPLPPCSWLTRPSPPAGDLAVYHSTPPASPAAV